MRVVILGGGAGGLVAAHELRKRISSNHHVVLVDRSEQHAFPASFIWLMVGARRPEQVSRPLRALVPAGVEVVTAEVESIDLGNRRVVLAGQPLDYDYLVIALGAELSFESVPGLREGSHSFYEFDRVAELRHELTVFQGGTVAMVVGATPYKCPGAPHEAAMLLDHFFRQRGMRDRVNIHLYTPESQPMPVAGPVLGEAMRALLTAKGIGFHPSHRLGRVSFETKELSFTNDVSAPYDLLVAIPPHRCPTVLKEAGLTGETGWVQVERSTLSTRWPGVYAIGDATAITMPGRWSPDVPLILPKAGVFAHAQAKVVAERIAAAISGTSSEATFDGEGMCTVETGGGRAAFAHGNFYAEPSPTIQLRPPSRTWHAAKVVFEKWWLSKPGVWRALLEFAIRRASQVLGIPTV